jgi:hypothetical protein
VGSPWKTNAIDDYDMLHVYDNWTREEVERGISIVSIAFLKNGVYIEHTYIDLLVLHEE